MPLYVQWMHYAWLLHWMCGVHAIAFIAQAPDTTSPSATCGFVPGPCAQPMLFLHIDYLNIGVSLMSSIIVGVFVKLFGQVGQACRDH